MPKKQTNDIKQIFTFLHEVENLKSTLRYNFTKTGRRESTAEHSWRLALLSFVVVEQLGLNIDLTSAMKMALIHDLPEAIIGDIDVIKISNGEISKKEKNKQELKAMKYLKNKLPAKLGKQFFDIWMEYEQGETKIAKLVKALDKIETVTQLIEIGHKKWDYPEFIVKYPDQATKEVPELLDFIKIIKKDLKKEFKKGKIAWKKEYDL